MFCYAIFALQIIFVEAFLVKSLLLKSGFAGIILLVLMILIPFVMFFVLYFLKPKPIWIALLSFAPSIFLSTQAQILNVLPFISVYFALIYILNEKNVRFRFREISLLPVILLGLINMKWKGLLENSIVSLLLKPGKVPEPLPGFSSNTLEKFVELISGGSEQYTTGFKLTSSPSFLSFVFFIVVSVYIILLFYLFKIVSSSQDGYRIPKTNRLVRTLINLVFLIVFVLIVQYLPQLLALVFPAYTGVDISISRAAIAIVVVAIAFISILITRLIREGKKARRDTQILDQARYTNFGFLLSAMLFGFVLIQAKRMSRAGSPLVNKVIEIVGISLVFLSSLLIVIALVGMRKTLRFSPMKHLFGEEIGEYQQIAINDSFSEALEKTKDKRKFILMLYFAVLFYLSQAGKQIEPSETPNEYLLRMYDEGVRIPMFDLLTSLFNQAKYSNTEIDAESFEKICNVWRSILSCLKDNTFVNQQ